MGEAGTKAIELSWKRGFLIARVVDMVSRDVPVVLPIQAKMAIMNQCLKQLKQPELTATERTWINEQSKWEGLMLDNSKPAPKLTVHIDVPPAS